MLWNKVADLEPKSDELQILIYHLYSSNFVVLAQ